MAVHLVKLCVGVDTVAELQGWIDQRGNAKRRAGLPVEHIHVTRMTPKRREELLDGGSLYWVIKGAIQVRQRLLDIRAMAGDDGIARAGLVLDPSLVPTSWRPKRPFQGWRYLAATEAPADLTDSGEAEMPEALRAELALLGLL